MKVQEITAEQYLAILNSGGDAVCIAGKVCADSEIHFLSMGTLDKKYNKDCWDRWVRSKFYSHYYTAVE